MIICLGFDFNAIHDRENKWVRNYENINQGIRDPFFFLFPMFDQELVWLFPKRMQLHKEMNRFLAMLDEVIQKKRALLREGQVQNDALEEHERDLLTLMIESGNEGEGVLTDEELKSNLCVFFLAGHDTTASSLTFAIHYLAQNPVSI
jgi:cytochrome P450